MWTSDSNTTNIKLKGDSKYLIIEWVKWQEKLNAMPAKKSVHAVRIWSNLIKNSMDVKVWNN